MDRDRCADTVVFDANRNDQACLSDSRQLFGSFYDAQHNSKIDDETTNVGGKRAVCSSTACQIILKGSVARAVAKIDDETANM